MTNWFAHCHTLDEARLEYRRLCFEHHPDRGGNTYVMQAINAAYNRFKDEFIANLPGYAASPERQSKSKWRRPSRVRPEDVAPEPSASKPQREREPKHSRDYVHHVWNSVPWQQLANGNLGRNVSGHTVMLVRHPAVQYQGAWFVLLDNNFSPYFYDSQREAEQAAFDLLYNKIKYDEL